MEWFIAVVAVAALGVAAMAAAGGMGEMSRDPVYDTFHQDQPETPLTATDLQKVQFGVTLRGYAMGQVDDLLTRLASEIEARDTRIAELTGLVGQPQSSDPIEPYPAEALPTGPSDGQP